MKPILGPSSPECKPSLVTATKQWRGDKGTSKGSISQTTVLGDSPALRKQTVWSGFPKEDREISENL
jgi:hypothetical protein